MANISESSGALPPFGRLGDKWLQLVAAFVYAAGVTVYLGLSTTDAMGRTDLAPGDATYMVLAFAGVTFFWIMSSAVGFMLLASLLDILTERRPQPISALSIALAGFATFEVFQVPLLGIAMGIWYDLAS